MMKYYYLLFAIILFSFNSLQAQDERENINEGVELYKKGKFADSEVNFKKGLNANPESIIAPFNLGDAYYKQERYDEAIKSYQDALTKAEDEDFKSKIYHNIGNSYLKSQKLKESIESYKNALKLNPQDEETKYNLSYALQLMNQQNQQQQQNQDNQDENKDNKEDQQDKKNDQNKSDQKDDKNKNDQKQDQQDQNKPDQNQTAQQDNLKQQENKISKEEAERILEALKNNEKDLQKKLRKIKGVPVKTDKDW